MSTQRDAGQALLRRLRMAPDVVAHSVEVVRLRVLLIALNAKALREASFLDDRVLTPSTEGGWVTLPEVAGATHGMPINPALHFIFHSGHVGSTLVSRLLDETGSVLGLREPLALRQLAQVHDVMGTPESLLSDEAFDVLLATLLRLWGRTYANTPNVVLKATSSTARLAPALLARQPQARAIYLNLRAEPYVAKLLDGKHALFDLRGHAAERIRRLIGYGVTGSPPLHQLSAGELAAMGWLAETLAQQRALEAGGDRVIAIDFDAFLDDVPGAMARIVQHLNLAHDEAYLTGIGNSPVLSRYAKAPEHTFTPQMRAELLERSRVSNGSEIRKGLAWLDRVASKHDVAAQAIQRVGL